MSVAGAAGGGAEGFVSHPFVILTDMETRRRSAMAAVAHPMTHDLRSTPPHLRLVRPGEQLPPARPSVPAATYWRRRAVAAAIIVGVVLAVRVLLGAFGGDPQPASVPASPVLVGQTSVIVQPGDSLWTIARSLQPVGDVRPVVDELARRRHGAPLRVGERIDL